MAMNEKEAGAMPFYANPPVRIGGVGGFFQS
jgi:hypothetical protein